MRAFSFSPGKVLFAAALFAATQPACALAPDVDPAEPKAGQRVTLTYKIHDPLSFSGSQPEAPRSISAGGATFTREGMKEVRWGGFNYLRVTYAGTIDEPGIVRVPSKTFRAGDKRITSESVSFRVGGSPQNSIAAKPAPDFSRAVVMATPPPFSRPSASPFVAPPRSQAAPRRSAFLPAVVPLPPPSQKPTSESAAPEKTGKGTLEIKAGEIFVGEAVPVVLKFPLRASDRFDEPLTRPVLAGDGFTGSDLREGKPSSYFSNGADYNVIQLQGTVVPYRSGTIKITDLVLKGRHLAAGALRPASAGQSPAPNGSGWVDFSMPVEDREIKVLELPDEGRPDRFTGAIGSFSIMPLEAAPREAREGQPVVLKIKMRGEGNFESVSAPRLVGAEQWSVHGPKEDFTPGQNIKTFEYTLVARSERKESPSASLSYFDPARKKYLTLEWPPVPLYAAGPGEGSGFEAVAQKKSAPRPARSAPVTTAFRQPDSSVFVLGALRKVALALLSLLAFTLLFFGAARFFLRRRREADAQIKFALGDAWESLGHAGEKPAEFYAAAAKVIAARLALSKGKSGPLEDLDARLNRSVSNLALRDELASIISRRDELNYGAVRQGGLRPGERDATLAALEKFCADVL